MSIHPDDIWSDGAVFYMKAETKEDPIDVNSDQWDLFYSKLQKAIPKQFFDIFFNDLRALEWTHDKLVLTSSDEKILSHIEKRYNHVLQDFAREVSQTNLKIDFKLSDAQKVQKRKKAKEDNPAQMNIFEDSVSHEGPFASREVFPSQLNPNYTFERFVKGPSNEYAYEAALAAATNPMTFHNPLYLFGGVGLGKTHLMMAIGNYILKNNPALKVLYVPSETFQHDIIESVQKKSAAYQKKYRNVDVLLIDDIQFISEKAAYTQEQIFHIFNHLYQNHKQIVISGDRPPQQLATLKDRLISRFQSGLIVDIKPPTMETREAILKSKSQEMGLDVPGEVIRFIATHEKGQVRLLEAALIKLKFSSELKNKKVDMSLASEIVREISFEMESVISVESIIQEVSKETGIKPNQILGKSRVEGIVLARHLAMYLVRKCMPAMTLVEVATAFGRNDHTTVMNAEKKVKQKTSSDKKFKEQLEKVLGIILSKTV